jgi:hypothetical protein
MQGTCCTWFNELNFPAALSISVLVFRHTWSYYTLPYEKQNVGSHARPRRRTGVAGGACAEQGAHPQKGMAGLLVPPRKKIRPAIDRAGHKV